MSYNYQPQAAQTPYYDDGPGGHDGYEMDQRPGPTSPYGSGEGFKYANASSGGHFNATPKKPWYSSKWVKIGVPVLVAVIIAAVVGGVVGSRNSDDDSSSSSSSSGTTADPPSASDAASGKESVGRFISSHNNYGIPLYPTSTSNAAAFGPPTALATADSKAPSCQDGSFSPSGGSGIQLRTDRPRLVAPKARWDCLPDLIKFDPYLKSWHDTILANASAYFDRPPPNYIPDGGLDGSGVLDQAREIQDRIKHFSYAYLMTKDTKWSDAVWNDLRVAAGNDSNHKYGNEKSGDDIWNSIHFLDLAEFTNAFAIAYDWLHDVWTPQQLTDIRWSIMNLGLSRGRDANLWWRSAQGNWNCVSNGGMINGAIAIMGESEDDGMVEEVLNTALASAKENCLQAVHTDGTWSETSDYWYFGTTGHAMAASTLITATGSDQGLITDNPDFNLTSLWHIYVFGQTSKFNYGDHGPNKFTATANNLMFYGSQYNQPRYGLYQRDRLDAPEPFSMLWYDVNLAGAWWNDLPLDRHFDDPRNAWASMRSSWTDPDGLYVAMKAGNMTGHQTHGDIDAGDFVIDALGERWAGELGSANYLGTAYFNNETADSNRWLWYRKRSEGQNVILVNRQNQELTTEPPTAFDSTRDIQGPTTEIKLPDTTAAYFHTDLSSAYGGTQYKRGIRLTNKRRQILLQDEITNTADAQWRMHTNATITLDGSTANLEFPMSGKKMKVEIISPTDANLSFSELDPIRFETDPPLPNNGEGKDADMKNDGVNGDTHVLAIDLRPGIYNLQVLFTPQWDGVDAKEYVNPPSVLIDSWSLTSH